MSAATSLAALPVPYDPWVHLARTWPEIDVAIEPMRGSLLGELRYPVIALRAGTSAAQRRCTLAHELVHLERGVTDCGPWAAREELAVHTEAARRLIRLTDLAAALRTSGPDCGAAALAQALDVDRQTLTLRVERLTPREHALLRSQLARAAL